MHLEQERDTMSDVAITITQPTTNSITIAAVGPQGATGPAGSSTASLITVANEATDTTCFLVFATASGSGDLAPKTNTGLTFNSATGALGVAGSITASGTTTTGDLVVNSNATFTLVRSGYYIATDSDFEFNNTAHNALRNTIRGDVAGTIKFLGGATASYDAAITTGNITASGTGTFQSTSTHTFGTTNTVAMTAGAITANSTGTHTFGTTNTVTIANGVLAVSSGGSVFSYNDTSRTPLGSQFQQATSTGNISNLKFVQYASGYIDEQYSAGLYYSVKTLVRTVAAGAGVFQVSLDTGSGLVNRLDVSGTGVAVTGNITASGTGLFGNSSVYPASIGGDSGMGPWIKLNCNGTYAGFASGSPNVVFPCNNTAYTNGVLSLGRADYRFGGLFSTTIDTGNITASGTGTHTFGTTNAVTMADGLLISSDGNSNTQINPYYVRSRYLPDAAANYRFWLSQSTLDFGMAIGNESGLLFSSSDGGNVRSVVTSMLGGLAFYTGGTTNGNAVERMRISSAGNITASGTGTLGTYTVATLPSASSNSYAEANVSDALAPTMGSTVANGGSVKTKVRSNGTNWTVCGI